MLEYILISAIFFMLVSALIYTGVGLYLSCFKLEKHPLFIEIIENALNKIIEGEDLAVFQKTYEELNANKSVGDSEAIGQYLFIEDPNENTRIKNLLQQIEDAEKNMESHIMCSVRKLALKFVIRKN